MSSSASLKSGFNFGRTKVDQKSTCPMSEIFTNLAENHLIPVSGHWIGSTLFYFFHCYLIEITSTVKTFSELSSTYFHSSSTPPSCCQCTSHIAEKKARWLFPELPPSLVHEKARFPLRCSILLTLGNWAAIIEPCTWTLSSLKALMDCHECATSTEIQPVNQQKKKSKKIWFSGVLCYALSCLINNTFL